MIDQKVLALGAQRAGIVVGDAAVQKMIMSEPAFQVDGKFSPEQYQMLLSSQVPAISPLQFQEQQRDRLRMMLVPQAISESDFVTEGEQARMWKVLGETRDIGIALLPPVAEDAAPVTDAQIKAWYDGHKDDFKQAEQVSLEYLEINGATLPVAATADEAALRKRYEAEKSRFVSPEQRVVAHILIAADAGADAATLKKAEDKAAAEPAPEPEPEPLDPPAQLDHTSLLEMDSALSNLAKVAQELTQKKCAVLEKEQMLEQWQSRLQQQQSQLEEKAAVDCGYWANYRFNPDKVEKGENPFTLDSKEPTGNFKDFLMGEVRYASLKKVMPDLAEALYAKTEKDATERLAAYKKLASE